MAGARATQGVSLATKLKTLYGRWDKYATSRDGSARVRKCFGWSAIAVVPGAKLLYAIKGKAAVDGWWYGRGQLAHDSELARLVQEEYMSTAVAEDIRSGKIAYDVSNPGALPRMRNLLSRPDQVEPVLAGSTAFSAGLQVIWPAWLQCTSVDQVRQVVGSQLVDPVSGRSVPLTDRLAQTLVLSPNAKRYVIAWQLRAYESAVNVIIEPLLLCGIGLVASATVAWFNTKMDTLRRWRRPARLRVYALVWSIAALCYVVQRDTTHLSAWASAGRTAMQQSLQHRQGAGEFIRQSLERNRLIDQHLIAESSSESGSVTRQPSATILPAEYVARESVGRYYKATGDYLTRMPWRPRCPLLANVRHLNPGQTASTTVDQLLADKNIFADYSDELL